MTRFHSVAALLLFLPLTGCAQAPAVDLAAEEQAVMAAGDSVAAAEMARDIDGALAFWADDAVLHLEGASPIVGKDGIRSVYETLFGDTTMVAFSTERSAMELASGGGLAFEHGVNRFQVKGPDGPTEALGKYLLVWRKQADGWRIAALAATNDTPPAGM